jgi:hypothetical protein
MVFDGSGGTATVPEGLAAGAAAGGALSWPTSGCLGAAGVVVVFLVFLAVVADAFFVLLAALTFLRQALRELDVFRLWQ